MCILSRTVLALAASFLTVVAACGGGGGGEAAPPFEDTYRETGRGLADILSTLCADWGVSEEPEPGEHNLECLDGQTLAGGVLVPDSTGYYRANANQIFDDFMRMSEESPNELCEHFGGGPVLIGVNWWIVGPDTDLDAAARATGARLVPAVSCE